MCLLEQKEKSTYFSFFFVFFLGLSFLQFNGGFVGESMYGFGGMSRTFELVSLQC
jgi:hypothetical protein